MTFDYSIGHKSKQAAELAIIDGLEEGEISWCEKPETKSYTARNGRKYYKIELTH